MSSEYTDRPWLNPSAVPLIELHGVSKLFGLFVAVENINLSIYSGEIFSLLGGSGCGKTTLLRMLAGFEQPSNGSIVIDGVNMTEVPPYQRPVNMMFQSYALFPHMNVSDNIAYGLKRDGIAAQEITTRVDEMLTLVEMSPFGKRKPRQLSGGQRQRVALARALVKRPKVLLLDEPLAALDKRLREQTQFELMKIQEKLGVTFIVVTHDQEEAMTLSTRIAVMDVGRIIQVGEPTEIYERPRTKKIADFIGNINHFEGNLINTDDGLALLDSQVETPLKLPKVIDLKVGQTANLAIRPEKIKMSKEGEIVDHDANMVCLNGEVLELAYMGNSSVYRVRVAGGKIIQVTAPNAQRVERLQIDWEDRVTLCWSPENSLMLYE